MPEILIVDDEPQILRLLSQTLEKNGHACYSAENAQQARTLLGQQSFDLLVTDIQMPGESGLDLVRFVQSEFPELAVVIVSVIDDPETARRVMDAGAYGYIVKPFERNQVLITVGNALHRRELETEARFLRENLENAVQQRTIRLTELVEELKKTKMEITHSARFLNDQLLFKQTLLDAIPNPIFYKDTQGRYLGCNDSFENLFGVSKEAIVGKNPFDIALPEPAELYHRTDCQVLETSEKVTFETIITDKQGLRHDLVVTKAAFTNSDGQIAGIIGAMVDITLRKETEERLKTSEEKIRQTLDNIGIGVSLISRDMTILEMNRQMYNWFPNIVVDQKPICFESFHTPAKECPCDGCPTLKALTNGETFEANIETHTPEGTCVYRIVSTPLRDIRGSVVAAIEMVEDITARQGMERELLQAQKLASIGQLAAGVAHEINNPVGFVSSNLTTLGGYHDDLNQLIRHYRALKDAVANLEDTSLTRPIKAMAGQIEIMENDIDVDFLQTDAAELLDECREGTERIKKIVEDLKHFAHPGQDKIQDTDINRELESTLNVVNNELKYKATVTRAFGELPIISANPQQLNQVFVNLLVNAAQAIEKAGEIRIETRHVDDAVEIRISDTGCGIPEGHLAKVFDPFFTTKDVGKGTGLGLNIAFNIIKKHRGEMLVESRVGQGTTFIIKLPVCESSPNAELKSDLQEHTELPV